MCIDKKKPPYRGLYGDYTRLHLMDVMMAGGYTALRFAAVHEEPEPAMYRSPDMVIACNSYSELSAMYAAATKGIAGAIPSSESAVIERSLRMCIYPR